MTPVPASEEDIARTMLDLVAARGPEKTICPSEVARALGGPHPDGWGPLMTPIRRIAVTLMKDGRVVIRRKGRPVDPDDFRGVYRIGPAEGGSWPTEEPGPGPGNSASERPDKR